MKTRLLTILMMLGVLQSAMAYTLTVVSGENGSTETKWMGVTGSNSETIDINGGTGTYDINEGTSVTIEFSPFDYQKVEAVTFNGTDITTDLTSPYEGAYIRNYTFTMTGDATVNVTYRSIYDYINITSTGPGITYYEAYGSTESLTDGQDGQAEIEDGTDYTITCTPDNGYSILSVVVNDVDMTAQLEDSPTGGDGKVLTLSNVTENKTVVVTYGTPTPEAYAALSEDGSGNLVLTFYYDTNKGDDDYVVEPFANYGSRGWDGRSGNITSVVFDDTFANYSPTSTAYWFYGMTSLTSVSGLEWLSTDAVTTMSSMFERCSALTTLDLSNFQTSRVTNMANMFAYCSNLSTIFVGSGWSTEAVQYSANMFVQCTSLAGGKGTTVTSTGADYARIDGGTSNPGYLTDVDAPRIFNVNVKIVGIGNVTATYSSNQTFIYSNSDNDISVARGESVILAITPNTGYALGSVMLDTLDVTSQVAADSTGVYFYTLSRVYDEHAVTVTFVNDTDEPYAVLADNTLTFYYDKQKDARQGMDIGPFRTSGERGWDSQKESITRVVFDESFANCTTITSTADWFDDMSSLAAIEGIQYLNTQNVTEMWWMFGNCSSLTSLDLSTFNTQNVTDMYCMFCGCSGLASLNVSSFNTQYVSRMEAMFFNCSSLTILDLSNFDTQKVTTMRSMFGSCSGLRTIYAGTRWTTEAVTDSWMMFDGCTSLVGSKGTTYDAEHTDATYAHIDEGESNPGYLTDKNAATEFDVLVTVVGNGSVSIGSGTIAGGSEEHITMPAGGTMTLNITPDTGYAFSSLMLDTLDVTSQVAADSTGVLTYTLSRIYDTHTVTVTFVNNTPEAYAVLSNDNTVLTFYYDTNKEERNGMSVGPFDREYDRGWNGNSGDITTVVFDESFANSTSITSTAYWFALCVNLTNVEGVEYLNTQDVTNMMAMFGSCSNLTRLDVSHFNTGNVTDMSEMFSGCSALTSLDLSNFNTSNVTNMQYMFSNCSALTSLNLSGFNTANVTNMYGMFQSCSALTNLDLSSFNTANVTNMYGMFLACSALTTIKVGGGWSTSSVTVANGNFMFGGCTNIVGGRGTTFNDNYTGTSYAHIDKAPHDPGYLTGTDTEYQIVVTAGENGTVSATVRNASGSEEDIYSGITSTAARTIYVPEGYSVQLFMTPDSGYGIGTLTIGNTVVTEGIYDDLDGAKTYTITDVSANDTVTVTFVNDTDEPYAVLDGNTLTFYYDKQRESRGGMGIGTLFYTESDQPWHEYASTITSVVIDDSFVGYTDLTSTALWFYGFTNLTSVEGLNNLSTANVTNMSHMFFNCSSLETLPINNIHDTGKVDNMNYMFSGCSSLTSLDLTSFNTENVSDICHMFENCTNLASLDMSHFNTQKVSNYSYMFSGCSGLTTIYTGSDWTTAYVTDDLMFSGCTSLVGGRGTIYDANYTDGTYARIDMAPNAPGYFTRKDQLMGDANDDGFVTIADAVATVTNILGEPAEDYFSQTKADMNNDSEIDIFDVTLIVNAVLAASPAPAYNDGSIAANDVRLEANANSLTMGISGSAPYTAFQFDVTLPEGTTLEGVRLANNATNHQLAYQKVSGNTYRVVGLSMTNQQLSAAGGRLVQMQLSGNADESKVKMSNVLFVGQPATDATAIRNHATDGTADNGAIYDLNGRYVGNDRRQLSKGIYIINHKKVNIK